MERPSVRAWMSGVKPSPSEIGGVSGVTGRNAA
jgi:hypothetical protein